MVISNVLGKLIYIQPSVARCINVTANQLLAVVS